MAGTGRGGMKAYVGRHHLDAVDDPGPARILGQHLLAARDGGLSFDDAWTEARDAALSSVPGTRPGGVAFAQWSLAFHNTRGQWKDAYEHTGAPVILKLSPDLLEPA